MGDMFKLPHLKAIVDSYKQNFGGSESWVSEQMGMDRRALNGWWNRGIETIPSPYQLHALAVATRSSYRDVLDAALTDFGYLPESAAANAEPPARMNRKGQPQGRELRRQQDIDGERPDPEGPPTGA